MCAPIAVCTHVPCLASELAPWRRFCTCMPQQTDTAVGTAVQNLKTGPLAAAVPFLERSMAMLTTTLVFVCSTEELAKFRRELRVGTGNPTRLPFCGRILELCPAAPAVPRKTEYAMLSCRTTRAATSLQRTGASACK